MTGWLACFYVRMCLWLICCCQWSMTEGWARTRSWSRTWARARAWTKAEAGTRTRTKSKTRTRFWNPLVWEHVQTHSFLFFLWMPRIFSQTLVILSSMFNLPIFKYATAHWFCLDPALWASFFRTDLCVSFHKFSLFLISPQKMRPPIAFWWPNFWFLQNMQQLIDFAWIPRSGRIFWNRSLWGLSQILTFLIFAENFATPPITLMTEFLFLQNMQQLIDFAWIPRSGLAFLEPISMVAFTISHFFEFCRKFCDPSCYFDDLISVFAKSDKNQGSEKSWKFSRPLWRSPNCFF